MKVELELETSRKACPSPHSLANKVGRLVWTMCWWLFFRPSPRRLFVWRVLILRLFGADLSWHSRVDPSVHIWAPWNLTIGQDTSIGQHVDVYNIAPITLGKNATVSQDSFLCTGSHDICDPNMALTAASIKIEDGAWVCARAFVGPGVTVHAGGVVGACGVVVKNVPSWTVVAGNPAKFIRKRELRRGDE